MKTVNLNMQLIHQLLAYFDDRPHREARPFIDAITTAVHEQRAHVGEVTEPPKDHAEEPEKANG